ncbi:dihydrolipoyl dehydrogenase family protein [Miltoncostaea oceani]|uniref:dihydrolipoyl dehydrogenase family protein n=1 Tax=Miltoncostaea oceani TaxID=2843216 RepID=UPI001C3E65EC|nr:FAD-dependent oxidoreductase [Miltoncostaea oceani]
MPALDLIVIGAGMAGINAAGRAAEAGAQVAVIERGRIGGTCPTRGCIPSKALIRSAEIAHEVRTAGDYGIVVDGYRVDMGAVIDRVQRIVDKGSAGATAYLESLETVRIVRGEARFAEPGVVVVGDERLRAPRVLVATGAEPIVLPIPGLAETPHLTSDDVLLLREVPPRLVVIGAGPIGLELGQALSRLGSSVTLIEAAPTLMPGADPEIGEALHELLEAEGIAIACGADVERVGTGPDGRPRVAFTAGGVAREVDGDALLLGAGRGPSVAALDLAAAGVDGGPRGIPVDARLATSREGHYAAGDVLGAPWGAYTHVARQLGRDAAENALGLGAHDVTPDPGPRAVFTDPEFATVGMTEEEARRAGHDVGVGLTRFSGGKARAWGQERGLVKVVADRATRRILGAHVLAYHAADLVHPVVVAMRAGSADPLLDAFHIHPTLGEPVQGAARSALAG